MFIFYSLLLNSFLPLIPRSICPYNSRAGWYHIFLPLNARHLLSPSFSHFFFLEADCVSELLYHISTGQLTPVASLFHLLNLCLLVYYFLCHLRRYFLTLLFIFFFFFPLSCRTSFCSCWFCVNFLDDSAMLGALTSTPNTLCPFMIREIWPLSIWRLY